VSVFFFIRYAKLLEVINRIIFSHHLPFINLVGIYLYIALLLQINLLLRFC